MPNAHGSYGNGQFGGLALDGVEPVAVIIALFQQPIARAQAAVERGDAAGMVLVDCQHQAVEEPAALGGGAHEELVHRRRQPHHAQMIAERGGRTHRLAVDPAAPAGGSGLIGRRIDAGAERGEADLAFNLGGDGPRAVALDVGDVVQRGAAQPAAGGEEGDCFEAIGLAGAVRPDQHDHVAARVERRRAIIAKVGEGQAMDAGGGHGHFDI
jgi:hypothetical protein